MSDTLYSEKIMSHYYHPLNYGLRADFDVEGQFSNPLCGDMITVRLRFEGEKITGVSFKHSGCVISRAAASLASEDIKNRSRNEVRDLTYLYMEELLDISVMPARRKCAALGLEAIQQMV